MKIKFYALILLFSVLLSALMCIGLLSGVIFVSPFDTSINSALILWQLRLPRVILAALVGAMLSVSGAVLQGVLKNPLSDPYILGVSAGGGLGACSAIILSLPFFLVSVFAFIGALMAVVIVYQLSKISGRIKPQTLILSGVAISSFLGAILTFMIVSTDKLQSIYFWMLGSFSGANWAEVKVALFYAVIGIAASLVMAKKINILLLGEEEALSLGLDVSGTRMILLIASSIMAGVSVSLCGMIGFVGLIVPHLIRLMIGQNNVLLIPLSAIFGAGYLVFADIISRVMMIPTEIPIGIVTALIGAPFFIYLLRRHK